MRQYKQHKLQPLTVVQAAKIERIEPHETPSVKSFIYLRTDAASVPPIGVEDDWVRKTGAKEGGYYVLYFNGPGEKETASYLEADFFESNFSPVAWTSAINISLLGAPKNKQPHVMLHMGGMYHWVPMCDPFFQADHRPK